MSASDNPQYHTMVANTVYTCVLPRAYPRVEVFIYEDPGIDTVWFRTDGVAPAIGADGSMVIPPGLWGLEVAAVNHAVVTDGPKVTEVKVITNGTPKVGVRGIL